LHSDPDAEINEPDLSDSGGNSDDGQSRTNVDDDDEDGDGGGGDNNDEDDTNDDWAVWDENDHFVPHLVTNHLETDKCLFLHVNIFGYFLVQLCSMK
jgi:hypothetical protein